jgi:adenylate cyclase class 2
LNKTGHETEIKLRLPDAATGRKLLRNAGFRLVVRRSFESNVIFDTSDARLRSQGMVLRIRSFRGKVILTLKGRSQSEVYKSRTEMEVTVSSKDAAVRILEGLGLSPQFFYEKYRTEYRKERSHGVVVLDETPIGTFFEIEGNPRSIDAAAKALGFSRDDYLTASYGSLYRTYCKEQKVPPGEMVFSDRRPMRRVRSNTGKKLS